MGQFIKLGEPMRSIKQQMLKTPTTPLGRTEEQKDHPDILPSLLGWITNPPLLEACFHSVQKSKYHRVIAVFCGI